METERLQLIITPTYSDFFDEKPNQIEEILAGVPLPAVVKILCYCNAQQYLRNANINNDYIQLRIWMADQPQEIQRYFLLKYEIFQAKNNQSAALFSTHHLLGFLHKCIHTCNIRTGDDSATELSPKNQLQIFKAYILYLEGSDRGITIENLPLEDFYQRTWPILINQFVLNANVNYFSEGIKAMCFFDYFQFDLGYENEVNAYLKEVGFVNFKGFVLDHIKNLQIASNANSQKDERKFKWLPPVELRPFYDSISIDFENYRRAYTTSQSFKGLKESPLVKLEEGVYAVIDWNLLARKTYSGLVFDFYNRSGIKKDVKDDFINRYKTETSKVIEKFLFRKLIKRIFNDKYTTVLFDDGVDHFPDAYVRMGNRIFLFEIKDSLFGSKAIDSRDFVEIKKDIDLKYNNDKKGTGQLVNQLKILVQNPFEKKTYSELKLKPKNITIYPVIVYTDPHYGMYGIESYLNEELNKRIEDAGLNNTFKKITRLAFIDLDFFLERLMLLQKPVNRFDKLMDKHDKLIKTRMNEFNRKRTLDSHLKCHIPFENHTLSEYGLQDNGKDYVKVLFDELDLLRGLPPG